jgi:hypothetical protein
MSADDTIDVSRTVWIEGFLTYVRTHHQDLYTEDLAAAAARLYARIAQIQHPNGAESECGVLPLQPHPYISPI